MPTISTQNLTALPNIITLQHLCKALATLDAIICREWDGRYYSYNKNWDAATGEEFFEMRDGSGDEFQILFGKHGAVINGFAHESEMSNWVQKDKPAITLIEKLKTFFGEKEKISVQQIWKGVVDTVPEEFKHFIFGEPVKSMGTTFCIWRKNADFNWQIGDINFPAGDYKDGSADLLYILDNNPATYKKWAAEYYEERGEKLPLKWVQHIYDGKPLTKQIVREINRGLDDWEQLKTDLEEIGYPFEGF